jgi:GntR family transcriptional regulator, transcriptional repressor for pyruvate dehydrogenase complex
MKDNKEYSAPRTGLFRPAVRTHVFQDIANQLEKAILSGWLSAGKRLPTIKELMRLFGTCRMSIWQALRILEEKKIIHISSDKRKGIFVRDAKFEMSVKDIELLIRLNKLSLDHLSEFRETIEGLISASAAIKADSEDIRYLYASILKGQQQIGCGLADYWHLIEADKKVHLALAQITGNPLYVHVVETTHGIKSYFERYQDLEDEAWEANFKDLAAIADAVEKRAASLASDLSRLHVEHFKDYRGVNQFC